MQKQVVLWRKRQPLAAVIRALVLGVSVCGHAQAQGYQDALGPGAESRALGGAVSAGSRGASAAFTNPAGLALTELPEVYLGMGISGMQRQSEVQEGEAPVDSELEATPLPVFAAALPLARWLVVGAHIAPVTFQGAAYQLEAGVRDARTLRMLEAGPDIAVLIPDDALPGELTFGFGYRLTFGTLSRLQAPAMGPADMRLELAGADGTSVRLGAQYSPIPELRIGLSWQKPATLTLSAAEGELGGETVTRPRTFWTLPARFSLGVRGDLDRYSAALEYRIAYGDADGTIYESDDGAVAFDGGSLSEVHSVHLGGELRLSRFDWEFPLRAGYTFESSAASAPSLSPFDPPASALHTLGLGGGVQKRRWAANLALTGRMAIPDGEEFYEWSISADFLVRFGD